MKDDVGFIKIFVIFMILFLATYIFGKVLGLK